MNSSTTDTDKPQPRYDALPNLKRLSEQLKTEKTEGPTPSNKYVHSLYCCLVIASLIIIIITRLSTHQCIITAILFFTGISTNNM